jgi:hypothetical protein
MNKLNTLIFRFLWKKKFTNTRAYEKVKRVVVCNSTKDGGLNMINVLQMQKAFILNWVLDLLNTDNATHKIIPNFLFSNLGTNLTCLRSNVTAKDFIGYGYIKSVFWKQAFKVWLENKNAVIKNESNTVNYCLWNNDCLRYRKRSLFFKDWIDANINFVFDITVNGEIMPFELSQMLKPSPSRLFEYNAICTAIRAKAAEILFQQHDINARVTFNATNQNITPKTTRLQLAKLTSVQPCSIHFWHQKYGIHIRDTHWAVATKCTKEERLKLLHWKILHNIYPTNILLYKMGIKTSIRCETCGEDDYIEHFFWHCRVAKKVWCHCINYITKSTGSPISLEETDIIFGYSTDQLNARSRFVNHVLLITKMVISKYRYGEKFDICSLFDKEITLRQQFLFAA